MSYLPDVLVLAHGVGGRTDLPLPVWQVAWAAACAVALSFVALGLLWHSPKLRAASVGRVLPGWVQVAARVLAPVLGLVGLVSFVIVLYAAWFGNTNPSVNIAPTVFYIAFWVGIPVLSVALGDVWAALNPMRVLGWGRSDSSSDRSSGRAQSGRAKSWDAEPDLWWAVAGLVGFVWLELAYYDSSAPKAIGTFLILYQVMLLVARMMNRSARDADSFDALYGLFGAIGPLFKAEDGMRVRWPVTGLAAVKIVPGTEALVIVALGSTAFDGFTRSSIWLDIAGTQTGWERTFTSTVGLVLVIGFVYVIYRSAIAAMAALTGERESNLSDAFAPSLIPIAVAYIVAHYFSYLVLEGQALIARVSDPFGEGWDLFGTATNTVNYSAVSTDTIAWVQTIAIVVGHILSVMVAHDRAVECFEPKKAVRSQYPMLAAMVLFTVFGLILLLGT